jgi:hypothetical protein
MRWEGALEQCAADLSQLEELAPWPCVEQLELAKKVQHSTLVPVGVRTLVEERV